MKLRILGAAILAVALTAAGAMAADTAAAKPAEKPADKAAKKEGPLKVSSVYAKKAELKGKSVTVKGKVVKYNTGIMGFNWIHIQDGSGKASDKTNDLTITSTTNPPVALGDNITATGTVATDKDFGMGYFYSVLVENATVSKTK